MHVCAVFLFVVDVTITYTYASVYNATRSKGARGENVLRRSHNSCARPKAVAGIQQLTFHLTRAVVTTETERLGKTRPCLQRSTLTVLLQAGFTTAMLLLQHLVFDASRWQAPPAGLSAQLTAACL